MILYDDPMSGNGYKLRLLFALTGQAYDYKIIDIMKREAKSAEFLKINPVGQIPAIQDDEGNIFAESNAMLVHFARGTAYWPEDTMAQTRILQWLFWEQYMHEPTVAVYRSWHIKGMMDQFTDEEIAAKKTGAEAALDIVNSGLSHNDWLVGDSMTIADISLFAYSHLIGEANMDVTAWAAMKAWIDRIKSMDKWVSIEDYRKA